MIARSLLLKRRGVPEQTSGMEQNWSARPKTGIVDARDLCTQPSQWVEEGMSRQVCALVQLSGDTNLVRRPRAHLQSCPWLNLAPWENDINRHCCPGSTNRLLC